MKKVLFIYPKRLSLPAFLERRFPANSIALFIIVVFVVVGFVSPRFVFSSSGNPTHVIEVYLNFNDMDSTFDRAFDNKKSSKSYLSFKNLKTHLSNKNFKQCIREVDVALAVAPSLAPWVSVYRLGCAEGLAQSKGRYEPLALALSEISSMQSSWFRTGPYRDSLRKAFLSGLMTQLVELASSGSPKIWGVVHQLVSYRYWLSEGEKARLWQKTGEWARKEKKISLAVDFMERSLNRKESREIRGQLLRIRSQLLKGREIKDQETSQKRSSSLVRVPSIMTQREKKLLYQMKKTFASGDVVLAVKKGVQLIQEYPGGKGAIEAADRVGDAFIRLKRRNQKGHRYEFNKILDLMLQIKGRRLYQWAERAYQAEMYSLAYKLALKSYQGVEGWGEAPKVLRLLGLSAFHANEMEAAAKYFRFLSEKYSTSEFSEEATLRLGMLRYREKKNLVAVSHFERAIAMSRQEKYELISRYWLWRSMERLKSDRARKLGEELMNRFPLTYYGLRARMELSKGGKVKWPLMTTEEKVQVKLWFTREENQGWERFQLLLKVGWFEEARQELLDLPKVKNDRERLLFAKLFSLTLDHHRAIKMSTQAWETSPQLLSLETLSVAYPMEYLGLIERESKKYNLDPLMVMSLVKQESSFRKDAKSVSHAMGLMQLMRPTAKDVARQLRKKLNLPWDLFHPPTNIQLGTRYMRQMIRAFKGHIPLALAAYNAGIGHMRIWLKTRKELGEIQKSFHPDDEMWIDELPWAETSYYVKAILRNYILYKALDKKEIIFDSPVWSREGDPQQDNPHSQ